VGILRWSRSRAAFKYLEIPVPRLLLTIPLFLANGPSLGPVEILVSGLYLRKGVMALADIDLVVLRLGASYSLLLSGWS
jgi:hypothetical protein